MIIYRYNDTTQILSYTTVPTFSDSKNKPDKKVKNCNQLWTLKMTEQAQWHMCEILQAN